MSKRIIELTKEQHQELRRFSLQRETSRQLIDALMDEAAKNAEAFWDRVAELAGYESLVDAEYEHGKTLTVRWPGRHIVVEDGPGSKATEQDKDAPAA